MVAAQTLEGLRRRRITTKMRAGGRYTPVTVSVNDSPVGKNRLEFNFPYFPPLAEEIKARMENRRWHGYIEGDERKIWSAPISYRNLFQLEALQGKYAPISPYYNWDQEDTLSRANVLDFCASRHKPIVPFNHQIDLVCHAFTRHHVIWAAEMGVGKSLSGILLAEMFHALVSQLNPGEFIWVGPKSALVSVRLEFRKWACTLPCEFWTYDKLRSQVDHWDDDRPIPKILILDESSRLKNAQAGRTIGAQNLADFMRKQRGLAQTLIVPMSGSPSPKTPGDWHAQCEITCPGYVRENNIFTFRDRLGIFVKQESPTGNFQKLLTWKDNPLKCNVCGEFEEHVNHDLSRQFAVGSIGQSFETHAFTKSVNEVEHLGSRLRGLVKVIRSKDCLDLPPKRYHTYTVTPTEEVLRAANLIVKTTRRAADALIKLRTLSDGFLYKEEDTGKMLKCPGCEGSGHQREWYDRHSPQDYLTPAEIQQKERFIYEVCPEDEDPVQFIPKIERVVPIELAQRLITCHHCEGQKEVPEQHRIIQEVPCPKDDVLLALLDKHEEPGRLNVYAGFQGTLDRLQKICIRHGWDVIRADGRGWEFTTAFGKVVQASNEDMIWSYQEEREKYEKIAFLGQPGAAGMGLTLTASPTTLFYSNDFNPESRTQAEARGYRYGMDLVRGGLILDIEHLPSDRKVIDSLRQSRQLEKMSMEQLRSFYK